MSSSEIPSQYLIHQPKYLVEKQSLEAQKNCKQEGHDGPGSLTWENINQMLNVANYMIKIWPSELFFYPASSWRWF